MCTFRLAETFFFVSLMYSWLYFGADCSTTSGFRSEAQDCIDILPKNYKMQDVPKPPGGLLEMYFEIYISTIDEINESDMDFELKAFVTSKWIDHRLNCSDICPLRNYMCSKYLWTPNIAFDEAKQIRPFPEREIIFVVRPPSSVSYTGRYSFKVGCGMYFGDYPFDTQRCVFSVGLFHTPAAHIQWNRNGSKPIIVLNKITPPQFYLRKPYVSERIIQSVSGKKVILDVNIILVRRLTGSIINIYAPSCLITSVSWVTFWLRLEAAPARVSLSITSLLTLCTQVQFNKNQLPPLNYITAVDIWLFVCIFLVLTLIEFAISYNSLKKTKTNKSEEFMSHEKTKQIINSKMWVLQTNQERRTLQSAIPPPSKAKRLSDWLCGAPSDDISRIDVACRKIFPFSFILFAIVYWVHYMSIYSAE